MAETPDTTTKHSFWEFKKYSEHQWFKSLIWLLLLIAGLYFILHWTVDESARYEYDKMGEKQLQQINRIYFNSVDSIEGKPNAVAANVGNPGIVKDSADDTPIVKPAEKESKKDIKKVYDSSKCLRAIMYIQHEFNHKVSTEQLEQIRPYLCSSSPLEAVGFLSELRFKVRSYFWLVGPHVYFEIIFWSLFGVIASLLFNLGAVGRNSTTVSGNAQSVFDSSEIPYQVAKLFYAPLCTLIVVFGYNYFSDENIVDIGSSKGVIVFAFIGGFYSARLISFLDRVKDLLLPLSGPAEMQPQKPVTGTVGGNVLIDLQLDDSISPAELRNDITEFGLSEASVSLENKENGEIIKAVKSGEDQSSSFTVSNIKPGTYIIKVEWSKEINEQLINLVASQEETIKAAGNTIVVKLKKDSEG